MRKIQMARKAADFKLDDKIHLEIACGSELRNAIETHQKMLVAETLTSHLKIMDETKAPQGLHIETADIDGLALKIGVKALPR